MCLVRICGSSKYDLAISYYGIGIVGKLYNILTEYKLSIFCVAIQQEIDVRNVIGANRVKITS